MSIASCAPCHKDHLQASAVQIVEHSQIHVPDVEVVVEDAGPSLSAHLGSSHLQRESPSPQNSSHSARCTMMAKHVKLAATSAGAQDRGSGQVQASAQENPQRCRSQRPTLGTHQCPGTVAQGRPHLFTDVLLLQFFGCLLFPTDLRKSGLWFFVTGRGAVCQHMPLWQTGPMRCWTHSQRNVDKM